MQERERCPVCKSEIEFRRDERVQGEFCTRCDWSRVTTYFPEILLDETRYQVFVIAPNSEDVRHLRVVSTVSGLNFISTRKLMQQEKALVFEGDAEQVLDVKKKLRSVGIRFEISPNFKY